MEIWKDIKGYEGLYQISSLGRIKSLKRKIYKRKCNDTIVSLKPNNKGYCKVILHNNGKRKAVFVHRLVAEHFIDNPDNLPQVNHKNEIKTDNNVENLEWISANDNLNYGYHNLRKYLSLAIHHLKIKMPDEKEIIENLEKLRSKI